MIGRGKPTKPAPNWDESRKSFKPWDEGGGVQGTDRQDRNVIAEIARDRKLKAAVNVTMGVSDGLAEVGAESGIIQCATLETDC